MLQERPYIEQCSFCGDGLLRFERCTVCDEIVAMCDECELMWCQIADLSQDPNLSSDSVFPQCPACGADEGDFNPVSVEDIEENHLDRYRLGDSP